MNSKKIRLRSARFLCWGIFVVVAFFVSGCAVEQRNETFHLRGPYNYAFYDTHPGDYKLTTVAHWAHGRISDILLSRPEDTEKEDSAFVHQGVEYLRQPFQIEPHQDYVAPEFARMAWRAIRVVDWTHQLHEQLYDIMTDPEIYPADKKKWIDRSVAYYLAEPDVAFSPAPFEEVIMERVGLMKQSWFKKFRKSWPKSARLFWAFHWWHPAVYEVQLLNPDTKPQTEAIQEIDRLFLQEVLANPPERMLLSREVMPRFSQLSPEAANIFDNLHMFHGIVYDILADVSITDKRTEIYRMIDLMTVRPGDRTLARGFITPEPDMNPLEYTVRLQDAGGEMARIMGHAMATPMKQGTRHNMPKGGLHHEQH